MDRRQRQGEAKFEAVGLVFIWVGFGQRFHLLRLAPEGLGLKSAWYLIFHGEPYKILPYSSTCVGAYVCRGKNANAAEALPRSRAASFLMTALSMLR